MEKAKRAGTTAMSNAQKLLRFLAGEKESISPLLILTHDHPDPDALATNVLRDIFENSHEAGGHESIAGGCFEAGKNATEGAWEKAEQSLVQGLLERLGIPARGKFYFPFSEKIHPTQKKASQNENS